MQKPANILIIRNDRLGDFMLAWPALSQLKEQYPDARITALVPSYTQPIADICPWIDNTLIDSKISALELACEIKAGNYDASISLYSELRTALALWLARIPVRIGPATKIAQLFLNYTLRQKRSLSIKPEYEYNVDLARFYITKNGDTPTAPKAPPYLEFNRAETRQQRENYMKAHKIAPEAVLIFIHPGSGGSAVNLSVDQFAELANRLARKTKAHFVITAGPDEIETANSLASLLPGVEFSVYHSLQGLASFARFISICDLFISGSTGPLHIAGALNVPTAAFYPTRRSATSVRWQTLNEEQKRISFSPKAYDKRATKLEIDITDCAADIADFVVRLQKNNPRT